mgnify:FL=1
MFDSLGRQSQEDKPEQTVGCDDGRICISNIRGQRALPDDSHRRSTTRHVEWFSGPGTDVPGYRKTCLRHLVDVLLRKRV